MARSGFSVVEEAEVWARWRAGESQSEIARVLGRGPAAVHRLLRRRGGIAPAVAVRSGRVLSGVEREEISRGVAAGWSARRIALGLGRCHSTVSREIGRNGGIDPVWWTTFRGSCPRRGVQMPRPHPPEFRAEAIRLARHGERSIRETALGLGISESCLRRWLDQEFDVAVRMV